MTGRELLDALQGLPQEDLELEVELYLRNTEDGSPPSRVVVRSADDEPYYKGDGPWSGEDVDADTRLIFIE